MASFVRCWLLSLVQYPTSPNVGESQLSIGFRECPGWEGERTGGFRDDALENGRRGLPTCEQPLPIQRVRGFSRFDPDPAM
jgi:hypothetical protein